MYSLLALGQSLPHYLPVVPIYVRAMTAQDGVHFCVCECRWNADDGLDPAIADLIAFRARRLVLPGFGCAR